MKTPLFCLETWQHRVTAKKVKTDVACVPSTARPPFCSQSHWGNLLCHTSSLKLKSQQRAAEGNGEERKLLSWHQQSAAQQPWATVLPMFFCSVLICEISIFKRSHMVHYLTVHTVLSVCLVDSFFWSLVASKVSISVLLWTCSSSAAHWVMLYWRLLHILLTHCAPASHRQSFMHLNLKTTTKPVMLASLFSLTTDLKWEFKW